MNASDDPVTAVTVEVSVDEGQNGGFRLKLFSFNNPEDTEIK